MSAPAQPQHAPVKLLADILQRTGTPALLVGGMALNAYGVARQTLDMDILLSDIAYPAVKKELEAADFSAIHHSELFARWRNATAHWMDIDILFVDATTFAQLWQEHQTVSISGTSFCLPSAQHLLAMKLHAARHGGVHRTFRDLADIISLLQAQHIPADDAAFRDLCLKYSSATLYQTILDAWHKGHGA